MPVSYALSEYIILATSLLIYGLKFRMGVFLLLVENM
jgi:hypothetical protein